MLVQYKQFQEKDFQRAGGRSSEFNTNDKSENIPKQSKDGPMGHSLLTLISRKFYRESIKKNSVSSSYHSSNVNEAISFKRSLRN